MVDELQQLLQTLRTPFWHHWEFWINALIGLGGLIFAIEAFWQAKAAREAARDAETAAREAGQFMTMQTVAIELMAISQTLSQLKEGIVFGQARTLLDEVTAKLHRLTSPFQGRDDLAPLVTKIHESLANAKAALISVRPSAGAPQIPGETYNAIEAEISNLNLLVNDLLGLLETKSHQQLAV
jgi:hypothetical protein